MDGFDSFIKLFGNFTISDVIDILLAAIFMGFIYKQIKSFLIKKMEMQNKKAEVEKLRDEKIEEALNEVHKYPQYRQQSIGIQNKFQEEIEELKKLNKETVERLDKMEETTLRRERNKIRDHLLQNYRYYTDERTNPTHSWTKMEAEAFWELFKEFEESGGDGYMQSDVMPEMLKLTVIDMQ